VTILVLPVAAAASLPIIGSWEWGLNWGTALAVIMAATLLGAIPVTAAFVKKIPAVKWFAAFGVLGFVVAAGAAAWVNPGGMLHGGTTTLAPGAIATGGGTASLGGAFDASAYEPTSKVVLSFQNYYTFGTNIAPAVKLFPSASQVTEKAAFEGTARPIYSATASSGTATFDGVQVQTIGCSVDVYADLSGYYQHVERNVFICHAKNDNGINSVYPPTISIQPYGTLSLALSATSLTCSAGSQCTYAVRVSNSAGDTTIKDVAVKFVNVVNATLDAVDTGSTSACELVEVTGTQYLRILNDIGPNGAESCVVKITRSSGSDDGSYELTANDLFQDFGATGWNTNSNIRGATATSALGVDFA
jgi:hypothetical protein